MLQGQWVAEIASCYKLELPTEVISHTFPYVIVLSICFLCLHAHIHTYIVQVNVALSF